MPEGDKHRRSARAATDEGLRVERHKTDAELTHRRTLSDRTSDAVLRDARRKADAVLSEARLREDEQPEMRRREVARPGAERMREDAKIAEDRRAADAVLESERMQRYLALASLLADERRETDTRLLHERQESDAYVSKRDDVLAVVSHDLRSFLGGIALNAEMLDRQANAHPAPPQSVRYADKIKRITAQMARLIGDLLDVASIDAGKMAIIAELHDASPFVREVAGAFEAMASAKGISFTTEVPPIPVSAVFDPGRIVQVLTNLVSNALKFTPKGGRIIMGLAPRGNDVCFSVADTGDGIFADKIPRIFERFFQGSSGDRRGLGLGLYLSKSIVESHGGTIWVESTPGHGSTFFFTLPTSPALGSSR